MTEARIQIHRRAVRISRRYRTDEALLVRVLQEVDRAKIYRDFGRSSLFQYAVRELGHAEPTAYMLIGVARKGAEIPRLQQAIEARTLSAAKASRIVACLTNENADEVVAFAEKSSCRDIDQEAARRNPAARKPTVAKPISGDEFELRMTVSRVFYEKLLEAQDFEGGAAPEVALEMALDTHLAKRDPVRKAERALKRRAAKAASEPRKAKNSASLPTQKLRARRVRVTAEERHEVVARDGARCTHIDAQGERCAERKWLHLHHIRPVSCGGSNDPANLTTLCSFHHDLVHQQSFPLEGQVSWLRAPQIRYRVSLSASSRPGLGTAGLIHLEPSKNPS